MPSIRFALDSTPQAHGFSANELMYGTTLYVGPHSKLLDPLQVDAEPEEVIQDLWPDMLVLHKQAEENWQLATDRLKERLNRTKSAPGQGFKPGQFVWLRAGRPKVRQAYKIEAVYYGPFVIKSRVSKLLYQIMSPVDATLWPSLVTIRRLKLWNDPKRSVLRWQCMVERRSALGPLQVQPESLQNLYKATMPLNSDPANNMRKPGETISSDTARRVSGNDSSINENRERIRSALGEPKPAETLPVVSGIGQTKEIVSMRPLECQRSVFAAGKDRSYKHRKKESFTQLYRNLPIHRNLQHMRLGGRPAYSRPASKSSRQAPVKRPRNYAFVSGDIVKIVSSRLLANRVRSYQVKWKPETGRKMTWLPANKLPRCLIREYETRVRKIP